jgi:hypothetical protein
MNRKIGSISGAALLAMIGTGLALVPSDLPADRSLRQESRTGLLPVPEEQERELNTIQNHTAAQARVVRALIEGQLTLQRGAEQLRDLHAVNPYFNWKVFRDVYPGVTDQERCCRQLLVLIDLERTRHHGGLRPANRRSE